MSELRLRLARVLGFEGAAVALGLLVLALAFSAAAPEFAVPANLRYFISEEVPILIITAAMA